MGLPLPSTLTPSKLGKFVSCPLAFRYSYIERIPEPTTTYQLRGTILHRVLQLLYGTGDATRRTLQRGLELFDLAWHEFEENGALAELALSDAAMRTFRRDAAVLVNKYFEIENPVTVTPV